MGGKGPAPKPTVLLSSEWRKKKRRGEPTPPIKAPCRPRWLTKYARNEWDYIVPQLAELRVLTRLDRSALAAYCVAAGRLREGYETDNAKIINEAISQILRLSERLGLSPSDRTRLRTPPSADKATNGKKRFFGKVD